MYQVYVDYRRMACGIENGGASLNTHPVPDLWGVDTGENLEPSSVLHPTVKNITPACSNAFGIVKRAHQIHETGSSLSRNQLRNASFWS